jgi:hypothetical protein
MLTVDDYTQVREVRRDGASIRELAKRFRCSPKTILKVLANPSPSGTLFELTRRESRETVPPPTAFGHWDFKCSVSCGRREMLLTGGRFESFSVSERNTPRTRSLSTRVNPRVELSVAQNLTGATFSHRLRPCDRSQPTSSVPTPIDGRARPARPGRPGIGLRARVRGGVQKLGPDPATASELTETPRGYDWHENGVTPVRAVRLG